MAYNLPEKPAQPFRKTGTTGKQLKKIQTKTKKFRTLFFKAVNVSINPPDM